MAPTMQNINLQIASTTLLDGTTSGCSQQWGLIEHLQNDSLQEEIIGH